MPFLVYLALVLLVFALLAEATVEPYPSITMPGFNRVTIVDTPAETPVRYLRLSSGEQTATLGASELFPSAPTGQRGRMVQRLDGISGTPEQWLWIDLVARGAQLEGRPKIAEVVLIAPSGRERPIVRLERDR